MYCDRMFIRGYFFFFLNDPAPPETYPLPLHDALPIWGPSGHTPPLERDVSSGSHGFLLGGAGRLRRSGLRRIDGFGPCADKSAARRPTGWRTATDPIQPTFWRHHAGFAQILKGGRLAQQPRSE